MKAPFSTVKQFTALAFTLFMLVSFSGYARAAQEYYAIKIYRFKNQEQVERVEKFLKEAYIPAMHRIGISKVGVFKPIEGDTVAGLTVFVWIPLKSLQQYADLPGLLEKDARYKSDGADYLEADNKNAPYARIETILLKAFPDMPKFGIPTHTTPPSGRIYELRSYEGPTEKMFGRKMDMFNAGGEIKLFDKLGFNAVFYAEVIAGSTMPNLMYMTTFADMKAHDEHWDAFRNHPEWKAMSALEKYKNTVSRSVKYLLHPTDYSDI
ncbi:MAG TPA: NIPSNAP family protein [Prolixibacteraceae bacterium]|nr:NIPSNAP family protein [Prolixibacteraceae bacterium]